jgi:hypothetical protein
MKGVFRFVDTSQVESVFRVIYFFPWYRQNRAREILFFCLEMNKKRTEKWNQISTSDIKIDRNREWIEGVRYIEFVWIKNRKRNCQIDFLPMFFYVQCSSSSRSLSFQKINQVKVYFSPIVFQEMMMMMMMMMMMLEDSYSIIFLWCQQSLETEFHSLNFPHLVIRWTSFSSSQNEHQKGRNRWKIVRIEIEIENDKIEDWRMNWL